MKIILNNRLSLTKTASSKTYSPVFGIRFKVPKLLTDVFVKQSFSSENGVYKIINVHPGKFGTECKYSVPLQCFEEQFGIKELNKLFRNGLSTNTEALSDAFLKSCADNPLSTSSVYDCSVMYVYNEKTNTHFLYHSAFQKVENDFMNLLKTFMPEGFTAAEILPGINKWCNRHKITLPEMLKALRKSNPNANINVRHYSTKMPEIVGYKGRLYEIENERVAHGFHDRGQASFQICDLRVMKFIDEIKHCGNNPKKINAMKIFYLQSDFDSEILKTIDFILLNINKFV